MADRPEYYMNSEDDLIDDEGGERDFDPELYEDDDAIERHIEAEEERRREEAWEEEQIERHIEAEEERRREEAWEEEQIEQSIAEQAKLDATIDAVIKNPI